MRTFEAFTWQHLLPILFFFLVGFVTIRIAKRCPDQRQIQIGVAMSLIVLAFMVIGSIIKLTTGTFDHKDDLPLYLCRIIAWMMPFVIWYQNRFWLGILYFWTLAGTFQGLITPDLKEGFPDYFYFRYWFLHAGLVVTIVYAMVIFRVKINWRDFLRAFGFAQVYLILIHPVNYLIGSNYGFTMRKPEGASIVDYMGPWPWYLLAGQGVMIVLFMFLMLPWIKSKKQRV